MVNDITTRESRESRRLKWQFLSEYMDAKRKSNKACSIRVQDISPKYAAINHAMTCYHKPDGISKERQHKVQDDAGTCNRQTVEKDVHYNDLRKRWRNKPYTQTRLSAPARCLLATPNPKRILFDLDKMYSVGSLRNGYVIRNLQVSLQQYLPCGAVIVKEVEIG